ncbi:hypothetical protein TUBRATIS_13060 [Tubulinosema ratisbonensis]|uniref:Coatomer subunit zeta n=1 Tax=Tubulinosema ratisbonensis TaxID=291195 RepID=A0A437AM40_9MICR|nr:hypothetical protein TUBRATIS_13060 [Tubulinosema ratisbonensis]
MFLILENNKIIYCSEKEYVLDELLFTYINGMIEMCNHFYSNTFRYVENESISINVFKSNTNKLLLYINKDKRLMDMKYFYKIYAKAVLFDDLEIIDNFLNKK